MKWCLSSLKAMTASGVQETKTELEVSALRGATSAVNSDEVAIQTAKGTWDEDKAKTQRYFVQRSLGRKNQTFSHSGEQEYNGAELNIDTQKQCRVE